MASSNKTPHYNLSQFAPTDKPAWQGDYNSDMKKIDNGIYAAQNKADSLDASVSEATNKATQALEKAEAAEDAAENAAALAQEAKTTADNISGDLSGKVNKAGDTMTGPLVLPGDPTQPLEAATKQYVDKMLPLAGGTMTGNLLLNGDPTQDNGAATKKYVDAHAGGATPIQEIATLPGGKVSVDPNSGMLIGTPASGKSLVLLNIIATIPQEPENASIFSMPIGAPKGSLITSGLTAKALSGQSAVCSILTATSSDSSLSINTTEQLKAGKYLITGWIFIREV